MSLKAKIEAVIYASEEPVTLQQLAGLLGQEVLAELEAADALQAELPLEDPEPLIVQEVEAGDPDALNAETLGIEAFQAVAPAEEGEPRTPHADAGSTSPYIPVAAPGDESSAEDAQQAAALPAHAEAAPGEASAGKQVEEPGSLPSSATNDGGAGAQRARDRRVREHLRSLLDELIAEFREDARGLEIREIAGGFRFATKPEYHDAVRGFVRLQKPPLRLTLQALETLAVVAYKQPVTAPEVSEIRGVDSAGVLGSLISRKLVVTAGRKQVIGRPILYKTTREFLLRFGLKDLSDLPSIEEFERLASAMTEAVQEEMPMMERLDEMTPGGPVGDAPRHIDPAAEAHLPQADGIPENVAPGEGLAPAGDAPGEFTGDETVPPTDNVLVDGRNVGVPPDYDAVDSFADSPAMDARIQGGEASDEQGDPTR